MINYVTETIRISTKTLEEVHEILIKPGKEYREFHTFTGSFNNNFNIYVKVVDNPIKPYIEALLVDYNGELVSISPKRYELLGSYKFPYEETIYELVIEEA